MSIPRIIHYCWFGSKPLPADSRALIAAWEKQLPDYKILRWDETTFDITKSDYVRAAYEAGKYAFVSDYVRLCALEEYGGVYLDTDIEVLRDFSGLLEGYRAVFGFESGEKVMTAFMAAEPGHPVIREFRSRYAEKIFDASALEPNTVALTAILRDRGLEMNNTMQQLGCGTAVFPLDHFQAYDFSRALLCVTEHTCTIHRCFGSWCPPRERMIFAIKRTLGNHLSEEAYSRLKRIKKRVMGESYETKGNRC